VRKHVVSDGDLTRLYGTFIKHAAAAERNISAITWRTSLKVSSQQQYRFEAYKGNSQQQSVTGAKKTGKPKQTMTN
jgi:translation initiation factor 2B subunit (eIF-2B alpha/beta/delta family)